MFKSKEKGTPKVPKLEVTAENMRMLVRKAAHRKFTKITERIKRSAEEGQSRLTLYYHEDTPTDELIDRLKARGFEVELPSEESWLYPGLRAWKILW
jgi:hypothetical protein